MTSKAQLAAIALSAPLVLAAVTGPLAGSAGADPPRTLSSSFAVEPGSFLDYPLSVETTGPITRTTFTERTVDVGPEYPGTSTTTWSCMEREGAPTFRCRGEGVYDGTYEGVTAPATLTIWATCSESSTTPAVVSCTGRFTLHGQEELAGLHAQATWQSSGVFGFSVAGTSQLRLHDHR